MSILSPNIQPWLIWNAKDFERLSSVPGADNQWELILLPRKPTVSYESAGYSDRNRDYAWLTTLVWNIWERVIQTLLPDSEHTGNRSSYDIEMPSAYTDNTVRIEVKTAQERNRGVIRTSQIERYRAEAEATDIYYAQIFYRMRSGRIPSKVKLAEFEADFLPTCIYIFPVSFIIYLINTIHPTGQKESTQFYGLTRYRAESLFSMLHEKALFLEDVIAKYLSQVFTTNHLAQNPNAKLHIIDHAETPHILGRLDQLTGL